MRRRVLQIVVLSAAFAVTTIAIGWLAVPLLAVVWGVVARAEHRPAQAAALGAALGWSWLLGWNAAVGEAGELARRAGGVFGLPGFGFVLLTPAYALVMAWGAAAVAGAVRGLRTPGRVKNDRGTGTASDPGTRPMLTGIVELAGRPWQLREEKRTGPRPQIFILSDAGVPENEMHVRPLPGHEIFSIDEVRRSSVDPETRTFADEEGILWEARIILGSDENGSKQLIKVLSYQARKVFEEPYPFGDGLGLRTEDELRQIVVNAKTKECKE
ncbi:MAG: hypothetical protein O7I93_14110 [Gemmatimonadetes bacterium]|nr:hypothetical protein [Gemmatimonadota bacterium]